MVKFAIMGDMSSSFSRDDLESQMSKVSQALHLIFQAQAERRLSTTVGRETAAASATATIVEHLDQLAHTVLPPARSSTSDTPPRSVALAMARALFSAPHLLRSGVQPCPPPFRPTTALSEVLGLPQWELGELREEVDRSAAELLAQRRTSGWLWHRFQKNDLFPQTMIQALFPSIPPAESPSADHRGTRVYVFDRATPHHQKFDLFARWRGRTPASTPPDDLFEASEIDASFAQDLARGLGLDRDDAAHLLDCVVCRMHSDAPEEMILQDQWRHEGWSHLTGLAPAAPSPRWTVEPIEPDAILPEHLVRAQNGVLDVAPARRVFDRQAMQRVRTVTHAAYGLILAEHLSGVPLSPPEVADLFDLEPAVLRVLQPLFDWLDAPSTLDRLTEHLGGDSGSAEAARHAIREAWLDAAQNSWCGSPPEGRHHTVQTVIMVHLQCLRHALARMDTHPIDARGHHGAVLPLFVGSFLGRAPLGRLWMKSASKGPHPEDIIGTWFVPMWPQLLDCALS